MKLEHIALNITDSEEIVGFYQNVLGMIEVRNYEGLSNVSQSVFFLLKAKCKIIANDLGVN